MNTKLINLMVGGGVISKNVQYEMGSITEGVIYSIIILLVKSFLVMITYNYIITYVVSQNINKNMKLLTIFDSIMVVILFNNLINRY